MKDRLLQLILDRAFQYNEKQPFILSSGKESKYYLDCRKITLIPEGMECIGNLVFERVKSLPTIQGIGGLTLGADPIAYAVMASAYKRGYLIKAFVIRKNKKMHGLQRDIEGDIHPGDRVVIVDDVVTTGQSTITAIERAREYGLTVVKAIVLIDRQEEQGMSNIQSIGVPVEALLTRDEIISHYFKKS